MDRKIDHVLTAIRYSWPLVLVLIGSYLLKHHYSTASVTELAWILHPTAYLVQIVTGASYMIEPQVGYLFPELYFTIVPSCAGVNFLIITLCTLVFGFAGNWPTAASKLSFMVISTLVAYVATLCVNTIRLWIAIQLHRSQVSWNWIDADQLHRSEGVVVYFVGLCLVYLIAQAAIACLSKRHPIAGQGEALL